MDPKIGLRLSWLLSSSTMGDPSRSLEFGVWLNITTTLDSRRIVILRNAEPRSISIAKYNCSANLIIQQTMSKSQTFDNLISRRREVFWCVMCGVGLVRIFGHFITPKRIGHTIRIVTTSSRSGMVATLQCPATCFDTLISHFNVDGQNDAKRLLPSGEYPLFVTWKKKSLFDDCYTLRGCIGTFSPIDLEKGLQEYSLTSALSDKRFNPVRADEISSLQCGISVLSHFETASHAYDWQIGTHGIMIEFTDPLSYCFRKATYLPEICLEQNWNHQECIQSLVRKSGFSGYVNESLRSRLTVTRYQSSKAILTYDQYQALNDPTDADGL